MAYDEVHIGQLVKIVGDTSADTGRGGVVSAIDDPSTLWPIDVLLDGEPEASPFDPKELELTEAGN